MTIDTELTKFRPFRNFVCEGEPDRASAGQAVTLMKFGRARISSAQYEFSESHIFPRSTAPVSRTLVASCPSRLRIFGRMSSIVSATP